MRALIFGSIFFAFGLHAAGDKQILSAIQKLPGRAGHVVGIQSTVASGANRFVSVNFDAGHEICDINVVFVSRDNGATFFESRVGGSVYGCEPVIQILMCEGILYASLFRTVYASKDQGGSFELVETENPAWKRCKG